MASHEFRHQSLDGKVPSYCIKQNEVCEIHIWINRSSCHARRQTVSELCPLRYKPSSYQVSKKREDAGPGV